MCAISFPARTESEGARTAMSISRKLGILVFCGVPAIVGGGIVYALYHSYPAVAAFETILLLLAGAWISR